MSAEKATQTRRVGENVGQKRPCMRAQALGAHGFSLRKKIKKSDLKYIFADVKSVGQYLDKIGCGSAIEASFIAFALHYL